MECPHIMVTRPKSPHRSNPLPGTHPMFHRTHTPTRPTREETATEHLQPDENRSKYFAPQKGLQKPNHDEQRRNIPNAFSRDWEYALQGDRTIRASFELRSRSPPPAHHFHRKPRISSNILECGMIRKLTSPELIPHLELIRECRAKGTSNHPPRRHPSIGAFGTSPNWSQVSSNENVGSKALVSQWIRCAIRSSPTATSDFVPWQMPSRRQRGP